MISAARLWPILLGVALLFLALLGSQLAPLPALSAKLFPQNPEVIVSPTPEEVKSRQPKQAISNNQQLNTLPAAVIAVRQLAAREAQQPVVRCRQGLCAARQGELIAVAQSRALAREKLAQGLRRLAAGKELGRNKGKMPE